MIIDVDKDPYADIIAMALPNLYWYEATNLEGTIYQRKKIGEVPATSHVNSQGFEKAQIIAGGLSEFVIAGNGDIYAVEIPLKNAWSTDWRIEMICQNHLNGRKCSNFSFCVKGEREREKYNPQALLFICPISVPSSDYDRQTKYLEMNRVNTARKSSEVRTSM